MSKQPKKLSYSIPVSREILHDYDETRLDRRFPRRSHVVTVPLTDRDRQEYAEFAHEWERTKKLWNELQDKAERNGWGSADGGYDWVEAQLYPLKERTERVYDETEFEWQKRLNAIDDHYNATGEWLEEPQKTLVEMMTDEIRRAFDVSAPPITPEGDKA